MRVPSTMPRHAGRRRRLQSGVSHRLRRNILLLNMILSSAMLFGQKLLQHTILYGNVRAVELLLEDRRSDGRSQPTRFGRRGAWSQTWTDPTREARAIYNAPHRPDHW
jgi:hypothetical protein